MSTTFIFAIRDREAGNIIACCSDKEEAEELLKYFEEEDIDNECFVEDFYEIVEF